MTVTFAVVETFTDFDSQARRAATAQDASRVLGGRPVEFASEYLSGPWPTLEGFDQDAARLGVAEFARRVPVMGGWVVSVSFWRPRPALPRAMTPKQALAALPCPPNGPERPLDARTAAGETFGPSGRLYRSLAALRRSNAAALAAGVIRIRPLGERWTFDIRFMLAPPVSKSARPGKTTVPAALAAPSSIVPTISDLGVNEVHDPLGTDVVLVDDEGDGIRVRASA